jgi:AcrR family transcriptional regulator
MSSPADKRRVRDAQGSRAALLAAARPLFDQRGFEAVTVREIGDRARVDPALIARYFGGKEGLYLAVLAEGGEATEVVADGDAPAFVRRLLTQHDARGIGPVGRAAVSPTLSDAMRDGVRRVLAARAAGPMAARMRERDVPDAELRAALVVALTIGVSLVRAGGTLPALAEASATDVAAALEPAVRALTDA